MVINVSNLFSQLSYDFVMIFVISRANMYFFGSFQLSVFSFVASGF